MGFESGRNEWEWDNGDKVSNSMDGGRVWGLGKMNMV